MQVLGKNWDKPGKPWQKRRKAWWKVLHLLDTKAPLDQFMTAAVRQSHHYLELALGRMDFRGASLELTPQQYAYLEEIYPRLLVKLEDRKARQTAIPTSGKFLPVYGPFKPRLDRMSVTQDSSRENRESTALTRLQGLDSLTPAKRRDAIIKLSRGYSKDERDTYALVDATEKANAAAWLEASNAKKELAKQTKSAKEREAEETLRQAQAEEGNRLLASGWLPTSLSFIVEKLEDAYRVSFTPTREQHLDSDDIRQSLLQAVHYKLSYTNASIVSPGISVTFADHRIAGLEKSLAAAETALANAMAAPILPRTVEQVFPTLGAKRRLEWTRSGQLKSLGTKTFRANGTDITYHLHDQAQVRAMFLDGSVEKLLLASRKPKTVPSTTFHEIEVKDSTVVLALELTMPKSHRMQGNGAPWLEKAASGLADWIVSMRHRDPSGKGAEQELTHALRKPVAVTAKTSEDPAVLLGKALDQIKKQASVGVEARQKTRFLQVASDIRAGSGYGEYPKLFPLARSLDRQLILHVGPTNSGKTHAAIELALASGSSQILSPLRLLALEHFDRLSEHGPATLVTGEEFRGDPGASHSARTVEAAAFDKVVDIAVIDEIQLLKDKDRGWAWTNAIVGIPARVVVMTGPPEVVTMAKQIAKATGEHLEVIHFERRSQITVLGKRVKWNAVTKGDAIIAFSRKDVLEIRERLIRAGLKVATIYGALGPEVRRGEAERFRSGEADVIVATDAIGMGLNLGAIKRVLFSKTAKFDGQRERDLLKAEIRQIAGRAGRDTMPGFAGVVGNEGEPNLLKLAFEQAPSEPMAPYYVRPSLDAVKFASGLLGIDGLPQLLRHLETYLVKGDPFYSVASMNDMVACASIAQNYKLSLEDKFAIACSPLDRRYPVMEADIRTYASAIAGNKQVSRSQFSSKGSIWQLEETSARISLYLSLARKFPFHMPETEHVEILRTRVSESILDKLKNHIQLEYDNRQHNRSYRYDPEDDDEWY